MTSFCFPASDCLDDHRFWLPRSWEYRRYDEEHHGCPNTQCFAPCHEASMTAFTLLITFMVLGSLGGLQQDSDEFNESRKLWDQLSINITAINLAQHRHINSR